MGGGSSSFSNIGKRGLTFISGGLIDGGGTRKPKRQVPVVIQSEPGIEQGGPKEIPEVAKAPKPSDSSVRDAKRRQARISAAAGGRARNILTSGQGLTTDASTTKKTLLGQ